MDLDVLLPPILAAVVSGAFSLIAARGLVTLLNADLQTHKAISESSLHVNHRDVARLERRINYRLYITTHRFNWITCVAVGSFIMLGLAGWLFIEGQFEHVYDSDNGLTSSLGPAAEDVAGITRNRAEEIRRKALHEHAVPLLGESFRAYATDSPREVTYREMAIAACYAVLVLTIISSGASFIKAKRSAFAGT